MEYKDKKIQHQFFSHDECFQNLLQIVQTRNSGYFGQGFFEPDFHRLCVSIITTTLQDPTTQSLYIPCHQSYFDVFTSIGRTELLQQYYDSNVVHILINSRDSFEIFNINQQILQAEVNRYFKPNSIDISRLNINILDNTQVVTHLL